MRTFRMALLSGTAAVALSATVIGSAHAVMYVEDNTTPVSIPGVAAFATDGAEMQGLVVTAMFVSGLMEQRIWQVIDGDSGGVSGTGWSLRADGDTFFANAWTFSGPTSDSLKNLMLDGNGNFTVFDRTEPITGTLGSAQGKDWNTDDFDDTNVVVTYAGPVGIGMAAPVGDLFQKVTIDFGANGAPLARFRFTQDTDNDVRATNVPEPLSAALVGMGLLGLGFATRRRRSA